jgi:succinate dehydrogenase / fumarate reductase iron-sulfur subunit
MNLTLHVWRQKNAKSEGQMVTYQARDVSPDMSLLEMLDVVNEDLIKKGDEPIAFDNDCREGICGACSLVVNGVAHGGFKGTTACQIHMRKYKDGDEIYIEPWRVGAFPVVRDLVVDRSAFDRIIQSGGYVSVSTGGAPDGNAIPVPKVDAETAMDAAACISCGACAAACKNASAMLFVAAKVAHMAHLPQGQAERRRRALAMLDQHDREGFGACSNYFECEAVCPKEISVKFIADLNRDYVRSSLVGAEKQ